MKKLLISATILPLLCGCITYKHERTGVDGTQEKTSARFLAGTAAAKNITGTTKDKDYERNIGVGQVSGNSDTENQTKMLEAVARGVAAGLAPTN